MRRRKKGTNRLQIGRAWSVELSRTARSLASVVGGSDGDGQVVAVLKVEKIELGQVRRVEERRRMSAGDVQRGRGRRNRLLAIVQVQTRRE